MVSYFPIVTGSLTVLGNISVSGSINTSGSITISGSITSASFATSASNATNAISASYANNLTVAGTLTAQTLVVQTVTSSIVYSSGSNIFGNSQANTQTFTGSVLMTGSVGINQLIPSYSLDVNGITRMWDGTQGLFVRAYTGGAGFGAIYSTGVTAGAGNFALAASSGTTILNAPSGGSVALAVNSAQKLIVDSSGNLGLGVTPSAWESGYTVLQQNTKYFNAADGSANYQGINAYYNSGWKYVASGTAQYLQQYNGGFTFFNAASGTAGAAITWATLLTIASTGAATFSSSIQAGTNFISVPNTDSISVGTSTAENAKYNYLGHSGYWGLKTTTTGFNFALDTYNGGTPKNVLTITQAGAATFSSTVEASINDGSNTWAPIILMTNNSAGANDYAWGKTTVNDLSLKNINNNYYPITFQNQGTYSNVGINEIAPNARLDIVGSSSTANTYGTLVVRNSSNTGISFGASGTSYTWIQGNVYGSGTQMIAINPQGSNVSIGTTTDFGYKLNLNGQPGANGYTAWTNWSDSRLKENITDLDATNVLNKICTIRPVTYNYNELSGFDEATRARRISGFIAQELMEVFPDMVGTITKDGNEYYDTNLSNLNLYLVKAIQELNTKFEEYKATHP